MSQAALRYRGVMFDLGGTLFDDLPGYVVGGVQRRVLREAGVDLSGVDDVEATFRRARRAVEAQLRLQPDYLHRTLVEQHFLAGVQALGSSTALGDSARVAARYADLMRDAVVNGLRLKRDCHETLAMLDAQGCDLTVVSNNDEGYLQSLMRKWRLDRRFRHWLSSDRAGVCKPAPEIFSLGLAGADMALADVLYVGDSVADDVAGARAAGMDVALLVAGDPPQDHGATYCISALAQLPSLVLA